MTDPKLFQLTGKDKDHYNELIEKIDIKSKNDIIQIIGPKIMSMMETGSLNDLEINLINEISDLLGIMELYPNLPPKSVKRILFAMSYFCNEEDEIPDVITDYGYLDDAAVVHWIADKIKSDLPKIVRA